MKSKSLIALLSDGKIHSGESLAAELGVSRTAIWKQVRRATGEGADIARIRGRGYQLVSPVDLLASDAILQQLPSDLRSRISLSVLDEVDSTNADVARRIAGGDEGIPVTIADCQKAGRGRRGRPWQSPRGENLYLSIGLTFQGGFAVLDGLSLVFGVAVAGALEALGVEEVGLKWPNDIILPEGKLGGILVELQGELQEGVVQVIAGIGLNVHMTQVDNVDQAWSSLARAAPGRRWSRNQVASAVIQSVLQASQDFADHGFSPFREPWQSRDIFLGRLLRARSGDIQGVGNGIDGAGNYLIQSGDEVIPVRAGEISLRVAL